MSGERIDISEPGVAPGLTHLDEAGKARMVDVSDKSVTERTARAAGFVKMTPETLALVESRTAKKG